MDPAASKLPREILPIPDVAPPFAASYDARDPQLQHPPLRTLRPPEAAPNVLLVLLDDVGFGAPSAFGGPCRTPLAERLAAGGLRYTRFHNAALGSPTRAALLSGRNHHMVGMGGSTETATRAPGYSSVRPNTCAPLAEILRLNGYCTAQIGKCHEVPVWESSPLGPFQHWPSPGGGFEHFYGFIGGEIHQYYPALYCGTGPAPPARLPEQGYHLVADLADHAIGWLRQQCALGQGRPFFLYLAPGATHAPHHVPREWIAKYRGAFDQGWDRLREEIFARQRGLGVIPRDAELTPRRAEVPVWEQIGAELQSVLVRQMETYAAFLEYADYHVGRVVDAIAALEQLDNTLIYYILGDNGASAEGGLTGTFNVRIGPNGGEDLQTPLFLRERLELWGSPASYPHYATGWAHAMSTPYQWTKSVASHWGGTRAAALVHWPRGIRSKGELRGQFCHVIDVAATILEAAGLPEPTQVHGVTQEPLHGVSMAYSFEDPASPERHETQYFEIFGSRGIYHRGWSAVTAHRAPGQLLPAQAAEFDDDVWELYDGASDWTQARDLAAQQPERLRELQRLFLIEAARYRVFPLDDRVAERLDPRHAGRPTLLRRKSQLLFDGMGQLNAHCVLDLKNRSHAITAQVSVPASGASGVLLNQGGTSGGWALYVADGRLTYCYLFVGIERYRVAAASPLEPGEHQLRMEFAYDGGGAGKGGTVTLYTDGCPVGKGRVERTQMMQFSFDETTNVGRDSGSPVSPDYPVQDNAFTGVIHWIRIDLGEDDHSYLVSAQRISDAVLARQ